MSKSEPRTKYHRAVKNSSYLTMETGKTKSNNQEGMGTLISKIMVKLNEMNEKFRREESEANRNSLKEIANQFEAMQITQLKRMDAQKATIKAPLPKYSGKPGDFQDWKEGVQKCIKNNGWEDEKRILDMLPMALTGQAYTVFAVLSAEQKASLDSVFASLKQSLDPNCKGHNREQFIRAKRSPGESMKAFISRCTTYITRADEIDNISESPWAIPFLVEKIYGNLNPWDRKILKSGAGKSEDINELSEKADELLAISEEVVGSVHQVGQQGKYQKHPRHVGEYPNPRGWNNVNQLNLRPTGPPRHLQGLQYSRNQNTREATTHMNRPGGEPWNAQSRLSNKEQQGQTSKIEDEANLANQAKFSVEQEFNDAYVEPEYGERE